MQKFIVIKDNEVKRVVVCDSKHKVALHEGESVQQAFGKIKIGTKIVNTLPPADVIYERPRRSYKDIAIGAGIAGAIGSAAAAVNYFLGSF
jgi:hypothetical protein